MNSFEKGLSSKERMHNQKNNRIERARFKKAAFKLKLFKWIPFGKYYFPK